MPTDRSSRQGVPRSKTPSRENATERVAYTPLAHEETMTALRRHTAIIGKTPESAKAYLVRAGLMTPSGRIRTLIRD